MENVVAEQEVSRVRFTHLLNGSHGNSLTYTGLLPFLGALTAS